MLQLYLEGQFKKDLKLARKRRWNLDRLWSVVELLIAEQNLPLKCRPHKLSGDWANHWECHIASDWLMIYIIAGNQLRLVRTGTHSDLFE
ncbi:MAG: type II toxin-antitoxin system YafQ family toxin [Alphaproteobacteria bacterium]|nr:MAG: type II toxin-antitoxin system YafQ family toxin [Alphaproteobacteria bacterium]